jgi:CO/xanthine dehydrogenase Mo-binding subunit
MKIFLVEKAHSQGPFGAKGMAEPAGVATAPAIANAICNACGVRIRDLPIKPFKVLKKLS